MSRPNVSKTFEYRGDLTQRTLPEILFSIHRFQVPGIIEARQEGTVKRVYVRDGNVVHATSSDLEDSLGGYLRRTGRLTGSQYERAMRARASGERRLGSVLVELDLLAPRNVYEAICEHVEAIVWSLFYWQEGEVHFAIGDFDHGDLMRIQIPMRRVILDGIKRAPNAKALVGRLGKKDTLFRADYEIEELIESGLSAEEHQLLRLVDGERTLYQICTEGPLTAPDNAKLMYAFQVLHLVHRVSGPDATSSGTATATRDTPPEPQPTAKPESGKIKIQLSTGWDHDDST